MAFTKLKTFLNRAVSAVENLASSLDNNTRAVTIQQESLNKIAANTQFLAEAQRADLQRAGHKHTF